MNAPKVVIVGSGIAGLSAAIELQKRGCEITILEKGDDRSFGGKLGTHPCDQCKRRHEHTHHIFLNWYHNFWRMAEELGLDIDAQFEPRETVNYLRSITDSPGDKSLEARLSRITDEGSLAHFWDNLADGPESPANMFLYGYSLLDLISQPFRRRDILDNYSVNGFMRSRWYATPEAALLHQRYLNVAFANPSFQTSGETYKKFIAYSTWDPVPQYYLMKQGIRDKMISALRNRLETGDSAKGWLPVKVMTGHTVTKIVLGTEAAGSKATAHTVQRVLVSRGGIGSANHQEFELDLGKSGNLILAVSLDALHQLVDEELYEATPNLERVHSLRSATISSLELIYGGKLAGIPREHTALVNSMHQLSFLDGSQIQSLDHDVSADPTRLTVSISSFDALDSWDQHAPTHGTNWDRVKKMQRRGESLDSGTDWDRVKEMIFAELTEYVPDMPPPGKNGSVCLVRNTGARLYLNDVHDWNWQPAVECEGIQNLFLAGEFVQNPIDAVTVESAVVTGLQAAEAIRKRAALEEAVEIIEPQTYPAECIRGAVQMLAPYALAAKSWTIYDDAMGDPLRAWEEGIDLWSKAADAFWGAMLRRDK